MNALQVLKLGDLQFISGTRLVESYMHRELEYGLWGGNSHLWDNSNTNISHLSLGSETHEIMTFYGFLLIILERAMHAGQSLVTTSARVKHSNMAFHPFKNVIVRVS